MLMQISLVVHLDLALVNHVLSAGPLCFPCQIEEAKSFCTSQFSLMIQNHLSNRGNREHNLVVYDHRRCERESSFHSTRISLVPSTYQLVIKSEGLVSCPRDSVYGDIHHILFNRSSVYFTSRLLITVLVAKYIMT